MRMRKLRQPGFLCLEIKRSHLAKALRGKPFRLHHLQDRLLYLRGTGSLVESNPEHKRLWPIDHGLLKQLGLIVQPSIRNN